MYPPIPRIRNAQRRARGVSIQAVVIPVFAALIGAAATLAAPLIGSPSSPTSSSSGTSSGFSTTISPTGGVTIQGAGFSSRLIECVIYEEGLVVPLARVNYNIAESLLKHSAMTHDCGLSP